MSSTTLERQTTVDLFAPCARITAASGGNRRKVIEVGGAGIPRDSARFA
jgi:hypothetical protein